MSDRNAHIRPRDRTEASRNKPGDTAGDSYLTNRRNCYSRRGRNQEPSLQKGGKHLHGQGGAHALGCGDNPDDNRTSWPGGGDTLHSVAASGTRTHQWAPESSNSKTCVRRKWLCTSVHSATVNEGHQRGPSTGPSPDEGIPQRGCAHAVGCYSST